MSQQNIDRIGEELIRLGWRQGSVFNAESAPKSWLALSVQKGNSPQPTGSLPSGKWQLRSETLSADDFLVVASQTCDIQRSPQHEPHIEAIRAYWTSERNIIHEAGKNSVRRFLIQRRTTPDGKVEGLIADITVRVQIVSASLTRKERPMDTETDNAIEAVLKLSRDKLMVVLDRIFRTIDEHKWKIDSDVKKRLSECWDPIPPSNLADGIQQPFTATQAKRLQEISGLDIEHLAEIFAVSPETYSRWLAGSSLTSEYRERLGEVLPLVESASQRLKTPEATKSWLLTLAYDGGKRLLDYLATRRDSTFRGFVLRIPISPSAFDPPIQSRAWINALMMPEAFEEKLVQHRPRVWLDDEDYNIDESRVDMTQKITLGGL